MEKSKSVLETQGSTLQERRQRAQEEQQALEKEVKELLNWTDMIEGMDETELKEYLKNRPKHLKTTKREKIGMNKRFKGAEKCKRSANGGIMAAVWKFHKEGDAGAM